MYKMILKTLQSHLEMYSYLIYTKCVKLIRLIKPLADEKSFQALFQLHLIVPKIKDQDSHLDK